MSLLSTEIRANASQSIRIKDGFKKKADVVEPFISSTIL